MGCEYAVINERRMKLILQQSVEVRDLYKLAAERDLQIRRLNFKRDSLEDIFLKAMETETPPTSPTSPTFTVER